MRFNEVTRQSVAKVWLAQLPDGTASIEMQPDCLAMEYLKTMASAGDLVAVDSLHMTCVLDLHMQIAHCSVTLKQGARRCQRSGAVPFVTCRLAQHLSCSQREMHAVQRQR